MSNKWGEQGTKKSNEPSIILSCEWTALTPQKKNNKLYFLTGLDKVAATRDGIIQTQQFICTSNMPQTKVLSLQNNTV